MLRIAHRGAPHVAPENSLEGFEAALAFSPDIVELDARLTGDGKAVVMHDATLDRTTTGRGKIARMSRDEVRAWRLSNGEPVPTLAEALDLLKGRVRIKIDAKDGGMIDAIAAELRRVGIVRQAIVIAYGRAALASFKAACPGLVTEVGGVYARHRRGPAIADARRTGAAIVSANHTVVCARFVRDCRAAGLAIHAWTVNDPAVAARMRELGVEAVATDRLDVI